MTDDEVAQLILEWAVAKGGFFTDEELDSVIAFLEEHFLDPEMATLEEAKQVLGLTTEQHLRERRGDSNESPPSCS